MDPGYHEAVLFVPGFVVPNALISFAPVLLTLSVGVDAVFSLSNLTRIVTPGMSVSKSAHVTTLAAVDFAVSHVPNNEVVTAPVTLLVSVILQIYAITISS